MLFNKRLNSAWWGLRIGLGAAFLAGLDRFVRSASQRRNLHAPDRIR